MRHRQLLRSPLVITCWLILIASLAVGAGRSDDRDKKPEQAGDLPLAYEDDFEREQDTGWDFTDKSAWRNKRLALCSLPRRNLPWRELMPPGPRIEVLLLSDSRRRL